MELGVGKTHKKRAYARVFPPMERKTTMQKKLEKDKKLEEEKKISHVLNSAREVEIYIEHTKIEA